MIARWKSRILQRNWREKWRNSPIIAAEKRWERRGGINHFQNSNCPIPTPQCGPGPGCGRWSDGREVLRPTDCHPRAVCNLAGRGVPGNGNGGLLDFGGSPGRRRLSSGAGWPIAPAGSPPGVLLCGDYIIPTCSIYCLTKSRPQGFFHKRKNKLTKGQQGGCGAHFCAFLHFTQFLFS